MAHASSRNRVVLLPGPDFEDGLFILRLPVCLTDGANYPYPISLLRMSESAAEPEIGTSFGGCRLGNSPVRPVPLHDVLREEGSEAHYLSGHVNA
jgi:hypothetical protein